MNQMVHNDITCNCILIDRFVLGMHALFIAFWLILIVYLCKSTAYLYCWVVYKYLLRKVVKLKIVGKLIDKKNLKFDLYIYLC